MKYFTIKLVALIIVLLSLLSVNKVQAEVYIDLGVSYIDEVNVTSSGRVDLFGYEVTAEYTSVLDVQQYVPMLRVGYIYKGFAIEYDTIGAPSLYIPRINAFYRFSFK